VESVSTPVTAYDSDEEVVKRRVALAHCYNALPTYATAAFWHVIENPDIPLEVLACMFRVTLGRGDDQGRNSIFSVLVRRTQMGNEYWAAAVLRSVRAPADEQHALLCDLCADLYESMFRALMDPKRSFWEENFLHALQFERKHVYQAFMMREGCWQSQQVKCATRIPRSLVVRLDQPLQLANGDSCLREIEDERAHSMLLAVEMSDLLSLVLLLPDRFKTVVLLLFWEGRSEKDAAQLLGITDRTVRNRKREALKLLREAVTGEKECAACPSIQNTGASSDYNVIRTRK
jgi:Sigma-70, region 4